MALLPRVPPASIVCPSAPFLAPRLLHGPALWAALHPACSTGATYATKNGKRANARKKQTPSFKVKHLIKPDIVKDHLPFLERFKGACTARDLSRIMELYPTVISSPLLSREDTRRVAQAFHAHCRSNTGCLSKSSSSELAFLERLTQDIRTRKMPSHPMANVHLLGIYKEGKLYEQGRVFWDWLAEQQDETFTDQAVYGAAIELLAYRGQHTIEALEGLYQDGLKRFPGTFAEYHLSPDAIVPDRSQPTTIPGIPIALLQGILTARILFRDWKGAYLALDTALRLYPVGLPQRFFELFITERSLSERYTIFLLGCRSGLVFKPNHLTSLLTNLKTAMHRACSLRDRITLVRGMANAMYAYLETGGTIEGPHVGSFLNAWAVLLPYKHHGREYTEQETKIRNMIVASAHETVANLVGAGMPHHPQGFLALINMAARFKVRNLFDVVLHDLETARVKVGDIGRRNILIAAGEFRDRELIERYWSSIVAQAETEGNRISENDWITLAKVCRRAGCSDYFHQQLQSLKHAIDTSTEKIAVEELNEEERVPDPAPCSLLEVEEFGKEIEKIQICMKNVAAVIMSGQPLDLRKTPFYMFLDPNRKPIASMEDIRAAYDELTTDPHQVPLKPDANSGSALSPTGIPLDKLRFQNWVTIIELMKEAETYEDEFQRRLDEAIASGKPLDYARRHMLSFDRATASEKDKITNIRELTPDKIQLLETIRRLRRPYSARAPTGKHPRKMKPDDAAFSTPSQRYFDSISSSHSVPISRRPLARSPRPLGI